MKHTWKWALILTCYLTSQPACAEQITKAFNGMHAMTMNRNGWSTIFTNAPATDSTVSVTDTVVGDIYQGDREVCIQPVSDKLVKKLWLEFDFNFLDNEPYEESYVETPRDGRLATGSDVEIEVTSWGLVYNDASGRAVQVPFKEAFSGVAIRNTRAAAKRFGRGYYDLGFDDGALWHFPEYNDQTADLYVVRSPSYFQFKGDITVGQQAPTMKAACIYSSPKKERDALYSSGRLYLKYKVVRYQPRFPYDHIQDIGQGMLSFKTRQLPIFY